MTERAVLGYVVVVWEQDGTPNLTWDGGELYPDLGAAGAAVVEAIGIGYVARVGTVMMEAASVPTDFRYGWANDGR